MYSYKLLKRFVKDYKLPIQVVQEPYFSYFMNLYDSQYKTKEKFKLLEESRNKFNSDDEFLEEYYKIRDKVITTIKALPEYKIYNEMDMKHFDILNYNFPKHDIFNMSNVGKYFISIDLKKANFQALKWLNPELVLNCDSYKEFLSKFTDLEYMHNSKYLREVIFGNMNPKRQVKVEKYMTNKILSLLLEYNTIKENEIRMFSNDELIFEKTATETYELFNDIRVTDVIKNQLDFDVDIEKFRLKNIKDSTKYFVKEFINKQGYELMCIPLVYHSQVYKRYNNLPLGENDLVFFYENQVCKFIEPLKFEGEV